MIFSGRPVAHALQDVLAFAGRTLRDFSHNQGLLLAGAVAYYALLSVVPLLILSVVALSHVVSQAELLNTLGHYLEWLVPSQSQTVLTDVADFLENRVAIGAVLSATIVFFSSLAFSVLEKAMAVIFAHRHTVQRRHFLVSAILPYCFVLLLCVAMLGVTLTSVALQTMAQESVHWAGREWSLKGLSGVLVYLLGLAAEASILTTLYLVLPVGRTRLLHALAGGLVATALWELLRHLLVWYFTTLSKANIVYGSLTTAVVTLVSMEIAATLFLLGAQVIAEYERSAQAAMPAASG
jgi:YihY family inner membrane protein